ncbi:MAG: hypothetical protein LBB68_09895, partial [Treponema sp.]|nr:hypothetical protein [Treponema sp.]
RYDGMSIGEFIGDALKLHRHIYAYGYANPSIQYNNSEYLSQIGDNHTTLIIRTEEGGMPMKPAGPPSRLISVSSFRLPSTFCHNESGIAKT